MHRFHIMMRDIAGNVFKAFTWTRDEQSGIRLAMSQARAFHPIAIVECWAEEI
jgi:hypothetical protein